MISNKIPIFACYLVPLGCILGCDAEFPLAEVSGVVTLDEQPLANATIFFQPQYSGGSSVVGPPSIGVTNESGYFEVRTHKLGDGAVVGMHRVSISTYESRMIDPIHSDATEVVSPERVPIRYRAPTELRFEVAPGGSDDANFSLTTK